MALAEQLRSEVTIDKLMNEVPNLKRDIVASIRGRGEFSIICDYHIITNDSWGIQLKYKQVFVDWARSEGFKVCFSSSVCGVKYIDLTL